MNAVMTLPQQLITIGLCMLATILTRFLPFALFSPERGLPKYIQYLGKVLPAAIFGMLVILCLKNVHLTTGTHGIPEAIAMLVTGALHLWKQNMFLSLIAGTACYMVLIQMVFA